MTFTLSLVRARSRTTLGVVAAMALLGTVSPTFSARAEDLTVPADPRFLVLPSVSGWFNGKIALYASTDTSDQATATSNKLNYAPTLANAANTGAVDDIYTLTNFAQSNIVSSAPQLAGPTNTNKTYSPLWQLSKVTWVQGSNPHTLKSEQAVLDAKASGLVTVEKTNIIINCPIIYTPEGGLLPHAHIVDIGR